jgi:hypothetical protein
MPLVRDRPSEIGGVAVEEATAAKLAQDLGDDLGFDLAPGRAGAGGVVGCGGWVVIVKVGLEERFLLVV